MKEFLKARVLRPTSRDFTCLLLDTHQEIQARASGNLHKDDDGIVAGDYVLIDETSYGHMIVEVLERKNIISRHVIREDKRKTTAANCDVMVIVVSLTYPAFKRGILDRYLVRAYEWDIEPVIVWNKLDQLNNEDGPKDFWSEEIERLRSLNLTFYFVSSKKDSTHLSFGHWGSLLTLKADLSGKTAIFLGQSGVGKSSLISCLTDFRVTLKDQAIGKVNKGVHTTTWSEVIPCGDFDLIDSPGIRSFSLSDLKKEELISYFPDLAAISRLCFFRNCNHSPSTKGCAFEELYDRKNTQDLHLLSRLDSFCQIFEELAVKPSWEKKKFD